MKKHANSKMDSFQKGKNPFLYLQFPLRFLVGAIATANSKMDSFQYGKNPFLYLQFPLRFFLGAIATANSKMDVSHTKDTIHFYICQTPRIPMCHLDGK